jgi:ATP-dependent helicase HrpA
MSRYSPAEIERRRAARPQPTYPEALPVSARREEIARAIAAHPVVIVCGETGSGKTTQLPKICLELGRGCGGLIGHTQPRRIAARSVAARIAQELGRPLGTDVGYRVRFSDRSSREGYIRLMTDGILLAEIASDRDLRAYDTLIIDEAHERSLNIDFLLGYLRELVVRRPDLRVVVTSATIDAERFSRFFADAPVIEVSGRLYPVEVRYRSPAVREGRVPAASASGRDGVPRAASGVARPAASAREPEEGEERVQALLDAVDELARERPAAGPAAGDILVFLPGEREIREAAEALHRHHPRGFEILPLYARLSVEEQERVFRSGGQRRIVLATNVAETSLTVPGIGYVVDTGLARVKRYSFRSKVEQLQVEPVSQASARQRAGRCGRLGPGVCIRLYEEAELLSRPEHPDPEIQRSSIAAVILRMKSLGLAEIVDFPFIDPPSPRAVADGYQLLSELGALDAAGALTAVGRELARFPTDPRLARILVAARESGCLAEAMVLCAALSVQDPRERPFDRAEAADRAHAEFADPRSDFLSLLALWRFHADALAQRASRRKHAEAMQARFLSPRRLREWMDVHAQLAATVGELGWRVNETPATPEVLHRALLAGFIGQVGFRPDEGEGYVGARGIRFVPHPSSALRKAQPRWVFAAELVETTRLYARTLARTDPETVERVAGDRVRREHFDPHWDVERGTAVVWERVTLYGLTLVARRAVQYGRIDPAGAHRLFVREALAAGAWRPSGRPPAFLAHNERLLREVEALEHKARRRDVLVDPEIIAEFYAKRVPLEVHGVAAFERWRREAEAREPRLLFMDREDLMRHAAERVTVDRYPDRIEMAGERLALGYRFEPGHPLDGVTVRVPLPAINRIDPGQLDWLVPGLVREKVAACFKALPKALRRALVPVPDHVTRFLEWADSRPGGRGAFGTSLADYVRREAGTAPEEGGWCSRTLPAHLQMNYRIVDAAGEELACGRDLPALRERLTEAAQLAVSAADEGFERGGITRWDFGDLPATLAVGRGGRRFEACPGLEDQGDSVALRLFDTPAAAQRATRAAVVRLLRLAHREPVRMLEKRVRDQKEALLALRSVGGAEDWVEDLVGLIVDRAGIGDDELPRTAGAWEAQCARLRTRLPAVAEAALRSFATIGAAYLRVAPRLAQPPAAVARPAADARAQLGRLVYKGFMSTTPWDQLAHLPRYLKAIELRLDKYPGNPERDHRHAEAIGAFWRRLEARLTAREADGIDAGLRALRWQVEELRVSLFAQELRTPAPVSIKRLEKAWESLAA